ncbi:chloride channel protein [Hyphomicrobium sp.]|jgi:hypothetical protein|uniref:chloride channel protein n=1 Tax=Hyphomicrobium sp. TaxID=82 RepID=UPI00356781F5
MTEIAFGLFVRATALITIMVVLSACAWLTLKKLGRMRLDQPFSTTDLRTWPLRFATVDAAIYGATFAAIHTALGDNTISVAVAAAGSTLIALRAVPAFISSARK